jgi:hypothetical protein
MSASNDNSRDVLPPRHILEERLTDQLARIERLESLFTVTNLALDCGHSKPTEGTIRDIFMMARELLEDIQTTMDSDSFFKPEEAES